MSARRGGEADKFGSLYESAWTTFHLLLVLVGRAEAVTVEDLGDAGKGSEFTLATLQHTDEAHQVKLGYSNASTWTPTRLAGEGVLTAARHHVEQGRQFHFISTIPAPRIETLADRASRSASLEAFVAKWLTKDLKSDFDYLCGGDVYSSAQIAWETLRGIRVHCQDEAGLDRMNDALAALLLDGAPPTAAVLSLGNLAARNLGVHLDAAVIEERLGEYELRRAQRIDSPTLIRAVATTLASWKTSIERELLQPPIPRTESTELADSLRSDSGQVTAVVGTAGAGKSAVLYQAVQVLEADNWTALGFRLDRLEAFASTGEIGQHLGLGVSPVAALAAAAGRRPSLLVIDQLDAVSLASGRMPQRFDVVADLVREAAAFPGMHVLLACRAFDVDNDYRIRQLVSNEHVGRIDVRPLSDAQIDAAVEPKGIPADQLTDKQRRLLRLPLNLVLLSAIADQTDALSFASDTGLLDEYWERKRRDCANRRQPPPRFVPVIGTLADAMSARQQLTANVSVLDADDLETDAEVLASEHVLVRDGQRYAFFHEAFFDYAFARLWVNRDQDLVTFLVADEQELFRRTQVRQILLHIRDDDPGRFVAEVEALLTCPEIRFHIKAVVLAVLRSLADPSAAESQMVTRVLALDGPVAMHLAAALRIPPWFDRLDAEDVIEGWLAAEDEAVQWRALQVLAAVVKKRGDRVAQLIEPHAGRASSYLTWLTWVTRFANVHESRALFDLMLAAVRRGDYNGYEQALWLAVFNLGQHQPTWAVELLTAWLDDRPGALDLDAGGRVSALQTSEHNVVELARSAAERASLVYCQALVPYLLRVMALTERDTTRLPVADAHFAIRSQSPGPMADLDEVLLHGAAGALRQLVQQDRETVQPLLEELAHDHHDGAQWLLYEALSQAEERYADWAAELLLEGDHRFYSGYLSDSFWTTRQVLVATTSHMTEEHFRRLEAAILIFRPEWESRQSAGSSCFELLSAMAKDRLSEPGRRRLGELQRRFGMDEPVPPQDIIGGFIGSPISAAAAQHMTDEQWLRAMDKHRTDRADWETLKGGVDELSQLVRTEAAKDPARFARLALRLTEDTASAYGDVILIALGETDVAIEPALVFGVVRHIAGLNHPENDRWLGNALQKHLNSDVPDDVIEIILDRALHASDPTEDVWAKEIARGRYSGGDIYSNGINCARGHAALTLGDLIVHDADGHRTELVASSLPQLANDRSVAVRSCVAHLLAACLRHARTEALAAYEPLLAADDRLLAARPVMQLAGYIGTGNPAIIEPVIRRMLTSPHDDVRQSGGVLGANAGLEFGLPELLTAARESEDAAVRQGAADLCARSLPTTSDIPAATAALMQFVTDENQGVRKAAAQVAAPLRGRELRQSSELLHALIASESFTEALPQLLLTLQAAPDRIDDIVLDCARRYIDVYGEQASDISTSAAGEAQEVIQLTLRAYAQASDRDRRSLVLDLIDDLLRIGAIGASDAVDQAER